MTKAVKRVAVTGGAGQIAYALLFKIANGDLYGKDQPVALHILELANFIPALEGVKMELEDCAFPLLKEVRIGSDPWQMFDQIDFAFLVGAKPRGPGMERAELLQENARIFVEQGKALNDSASRDVKVLVVGNPCNTNCLIAIHHAPNIPKENFHAMTRLDQNRAKSMLAKKAGVEVEEVKNVTIWGNHSTTQVPDYYNAKIKDKSAPDVIKEAQWFEADFIPAVQKRGATVIAARGKSSAASAANAAVDAAKSLLFPTKENDWFSSGIYTENNPYTIADNLVFSFPCRVNQEGKIEIVKDVNLNDSLKTKLKASEKELLEERTIIADLLTKPLVIKK